MEPKNKHNTRTGAQAAKTSADYSDAFKYMWFGCLTVLILVGCWMVFKNESATEVGMQRHGGIRPQTINGYGVLSIAATLLVITIAAMFWPKRKKGREAR